MQSRTPPDHPSPGEICFGTSEEDPVGVDTPARQPRAPATPRRPREGTKQQTVLALLRRPEGATIADVITVTGWAQHTVRGFLAGLKKKGISVTVLERVRQVGPGKEGAKGSYSIYRVGEAA
ncbi:DUF3489 domain-containing protein [Muricoccus radiodurans]|uniref:DUF3489 domain-containing protein n=1 Tax=Muricoccus radiodurans TaxID=2231721 RepID=UPI003CE7D160